ncbi:MAG: glycosyl-4,4'-diaponeurosporenoate acyltransferase [Chitinivibrionales bacterium]|nr:glycosyl-4,4'-diaponeurosporenoate acyltransferase [Chitinivibrionales bacterium]
MRLWHFSNLLTVIIDFAAWFVLHMLIALGGTLLPRRLFHEKQWLFRSRGWEKKGDFYQQLFGVIGWKDKLPDGASWFRGGFAKKRVASTNVEYLDNFVKETCRGELVHWIVVAVSPVFFLWNPWYAGIIMIVYALASNIPCIIVQRYNRPQLMRIVKRRREYIRKQHQPVETGEKI